MKSLRGDVVYALAFSPDGGVLAVAYDDTFVRMWNVTSGRVTQLFQGHEYPVPSAAFSPDGSLLATSANTFGAGSMGNGIRSEGIRLWEVASGRLIARFHALPRQEWVAIGEEGFVASPKADQYLRLVRDGAEELVDDDFKKRFLLEELPESGFTTKRCGGRSC